jgi:hypothetical protein
MRFLSVAKKRNPTTMKNVERLLAIVGGALAGIVQQQKAG